MATGLMRPPPHLQSAMCYLRYLIAVIVSALASTLPEETIWKPSVVNRSIDVVGTIML